MSDTHKCDNCERLESRTLRRTADGAPITEGMTVWDYDWRRSIVKIADTYADPEFEYHEYWDGWYKMASPITGRPMSTMNGERMYVRHPGTGEKA